MYWKTLNGEKSGLEGRDIEHGSPPPIANGRDALKRMAGFGVAPKIASKHG